jgi:hypothetical protein
LQVAGLEVLMAAVEVLAVIDLLLLVNLLVAAQAQNQD